VFLTSTGSQDLATADSITNVGYADAQAQPGLMGNSIMTTGSAGESSTSFQNESLSGFKDTLTINSPGLTGSSGTLQFNFTIDGTETFAAAAPALSSITTSATFTASGSPGATDDLSFTKDSSNNVTGTDFLGVLQTVTVPFVFGTPFTIDLTVDITALVEGLTGPGSAMASGTFSTTASTDDVTALVASAPQGLSDFTSQSASGEDYFTPLTSIPEPNGLLLAIAGLGALPLLKMRRRRP
jgi:hypothetical protein